VQFVAAGFDLAAFWRLTPRSVTLMLKGAQLRMRAQKLAMAESVRAGSRLDGPEFERWHAEVGGQPTRLPPEAVGGVLRQAGANLNVISWAEALERMK